MEVAEKPSTELTLPQRAAVALGSSELEQNLKALAKKHTDIVAVTDGTGRDQVHGAAMTLKSNRVAIQKTAKAAREDATAFQKAVIAEENRLVEIIEPEEKRLLELRDGYDAKVQAEREARIAAERERIDGIKTRIQNIRDIVIGVAGMTSQDIDIARNETAAIEADDELIYAEFVPEAKAAVAETLDKLHSMFVIAVNAEQKAAQEAADHAAEAKRIADEREELAKQRQAQEAAAEASRLALEAERAELAKQRAADEEAAAAQRKIEAYKLAEQRAELAAQQAAIDAQRREQEEAARVAQAKIDADAKAAADAEAKRLQDAADEAMRQKNEEHIKSVNQELHHFLCCDIGLEPEIATKLIAEIAADNAPHLTITY